MDDQGGGDDEDDDDDDDDDDDEGEGEAAGGGDDADEAAADAAAAGSSSFGRARLAPRSCRRRRAPRAARRLAAPPRLRRRVRPPPRRPPAPARIVARVRASFAAEPAAVCALAALPLETALAAAAADGGGGGVAAWGSGVRGGAAAGEQGVRRGGDRRAARRCAGRPSAQISARHCGALDALMRARPPFDPAVVRRVAVLLLRASRRAHRARATPLVYRRWALLRLLRDPLVYAARPLHDLPGGGDGDGAGWVAAVEWPQPASAAAATAALKVCEAGPAATRPTPPSTPSA